MTVLPEFDAVVESLALRDRDDLVIAPAIPMASVAAGVIVQDHLGRIVGWNDATLHLLGQSAAELTGVTSLDPRWRAIRADGSPFPGELHPAVVTRTTGEALDDVVMGVRRPDGSLIWLNVSSRPLVAERPCDGVVVTFVDITRERATERVLRTVWAVDQALLRSSSENELLAEMCIAAVDGDPRSLAWVAVGNDDDAHSVSIVAAAGMTDYVYDGIVSWSAADVLGQGPSGTAIRERRTVLIDDLENEDTFSPWRERAQRFGLASVVAVPFRIGGQHAAFTIFYPVAEVISEDGVRLLGQVGADLEYGIANLRRVKAQADSLDSIVQAMAALTEVRDPYTSGHQRRVAQLAVAMGIELGLSPVDLDMLRLGALVHDIGKLGVPAEILSKPGPLEPIEYELVKRHVAVGELTLRRGSLPSPVPEIAGQHHERIDGSGYPRGLRGDEIEYLARIVSVADVLEAMMHHRPYRAAMGIDVALATLCAGAGVRFEAAVVDACTRVIEKGFTFDDR